MRILVVEDDRLLNNTLCYNLDTAGYAVDSALTKSAASNFLTKQDYDLIVLDVNLPDGNGFDFCREVKERRPDTAVIFLTANDMETLLLLAVGAVCTAVHLLTQNITAVRCVFLFSLFVLLCVIFFVALIRRKLVRFSDAFCGQMDDMLSENMQPKQTTCEESLFYKINYRLGRLYEVMQENKNSIAKERADLQELISDISHQVKTPIANLKMINNTLLENEVPPQKQKEFLTAQASQLDKLGFLMQAMIKTSRLETGVISLEQRQQPVYDTLAAALGGILLNAEKKKIDVQVECPEHLDARHDRKWTSEALFNILDNAVKYTPAGGQIRVSVEGWEMYVKIDIADTGIGISEQHQGTIFKRFYREDVVHDVDGIGIGLYLAREIVTLQGGYIRVASEVGKGSTFSVFLLRK